MRNAGYLAHLSEWGHSFTRLFAATRSALRERINLLTLRKSYGTASRRMRGFGALQDASLPGFEPSRKESHGTASVPQLSLSRGPARKKPPSTQRKNYPKNTTKSGHLSRQRKPMGWR
jgi:hypothetical protein